MRKFIIPVVVSALALLAPSLAHAGGPSLGITTPGEIDLQVGDTATINYGGWCNLGAGNNGTIHIFAIENPSVDLVPPITIPDTSGTSGQYSGSVTYTFTQAGTFTVDARLTGSLNGSCDLSTVSDGLTINFSISEAATTTTIINDGMPIPQAGSDSSVLVVTALLLLAAGGLLVARRRIS